MADEDELHRSVTEFMLDTCHYSPRSSEVNFYLARAMREELLKEFVRNYQIYDDGYLEWFISGSSAEFYIKPLLSCIDDIDIMSRVHCAIVIPAGQNPPTELSDYGLKSTVLVYEIVDSHQPGYVYLHLVIHGSGRRRRTL